MESFELARQNVHRPIQKAKSERKYMKERRLGEAIYGSLWHEYWHQHSKEHLLKVREVKLNIHTLKCALLCISNKAKAQTICEPHGKSNEHYKSRKTAQNRLMNMKTGRIHRWHWRLQSNRPNYCAWSSLSLFKVRLMDQHCHHHLGACGKCRIPALIPDSLNWNLQFNKIPKGLIGTLNFSKNSFGNSELSY